MLDDFDRLAVADEFAALLDDSLLRDVTNKVVDTEEVVEPVKRREATVVIKGDFTTGSYSSQVSQPSKSGQGQDTYSIGKGQQVGQRRQLRGQRP